MWGMHKKSVEQQLSDASEDHDDVVNYFVPTPAGEGLALFCLGISTVSIT